MKLSFPAKSLDEIVNQINDMLTGRELGKIAKVSREGDDLLVTLSKFGTSTLIFSFENKDNQLCGELTSEKIAFTHRAFRDEVKEHLVKVIEKCGGKVS